MKLAILVGEQGRHSNKKLAHCDMGQIGGKRQTLHQQSLQAFVG